MPHEKTGSVPTELAFENPFPNVQMNPELPLLAPQQPHSVTTTSGLPSPVTSPTRTLPMVPISPFGSTHSMAPVFAATTKTWSFE